MSVRLTPRGNVLYQPDGAVLSQFFFEKPKFSVIQGPIGCLSADTEFLTPYGWKRMDQYEAGDRVFVWDDGKARFEHPEAYIAAPCDQMWHFSNAHSLSMMLSDEHRVLLLDRNGKYRVCLAADLAAAPGRHTLPVTFEVDGAPFDESQLRLMVAIAADGCFPKRGNQVVITVRKDRKKERIRQLLFKNRIEFKEHQHSTRPTELAFAFQRQDWMSKTLNLIGCGTPRCEVVIDEMRHWDGLFEGDDIRFDGKCRETAEFMQYAAHATGRRATITTKIDKRNADWSPTYAVIISHKDSPKTAVGIRRDSTSIERVPTPDGRKYCFTTSTGYFIARHNGRIFVTGNSGTSSASCMKIWKLACEQEPDFDGIRRTRWLIVRRTYKELRETTIKTWLHWFPESDWGQFIRAEPAQHHLKDTKTGGPRQHPSGDGTFVDCEVIFIAIPDPDVAEEVCASYEITGFFQNEGQFGEKEVVDELLSRCGRYPSMSRGPGASWYGGWMDMNAPLEGHWVPYMRGDIPLPPEMSEDEAMAFEKPDDWKFYIQPPGLIETIVDGRPHYEPNPEAENQQWLIESYLDKVKGKPRQWVDRRVLNKIGLYMDGKPVYETYADAEHKAKDGLEPVPGVEIIVGLDGGREPAAVFCQHVNNQWRVLSELIGKNESAQRFAPKVKKHLAQKYPGYAVEMWGDPRYDDGNQTTEDTGFDVFAKHGMTVRPATSDNNVELRRSSMELVLERRNGMSVNQSCIVLRRGLAGGYHYRKIKGTKIYSPKPVKNEYSHVVEALENAIIGGGEGYAVVDNPHRPKPEPVPIKRARQGLRGRKGLRRARR